MVSVVLAGDLRVVTKYTYEKLLWRGFSSWLSPSLWSRWETEFLLFPFTEPTG